VTRLALALLLAAGALACKTPAALPERGAISTQRRIAPIVPDELDHAAADLAVATLANDPAAVASSLTALERAEHARGPDAKPTCLVPAGIEAADAVRAPGREGRAAAERMLERDDVDAASRARLERWLEDDPLALAVKRIGEARWVAFARLFNAVSEPVGRSIMTTALLPYSLGNALAHYTIDFAREDALPLQRRQALAHWQRFRREYPDSPEVAELGPEIEEYEAALRETQAGRARDLAEDALGDGAPDAAWIYARRANRYVDDERAHELMRKAELRIAARRDALARTLAFRAGAPPQPDERGPIVAALSGGPTPLGRVADGDASWPILERIEDESDSPLARHAGAELVDPVRNPYRAFVHTRTAERWSTASWVMLGPLAEPPERGALGAIEYLLDLPWKVQGALVFPIRLIQLPWRPSTPGAAEVAVHGRRYLDASPHGEHSDEVRDWLESFEEHRENWVGALRVAEGRPDASDAELDVLREKAAEQALNVAKDEHRSDLRARLLANVVREFPETRAGREAGSAAREQVSEHTAHAVRLSRGFLLENPRVAGPNGLDLDTALLDGDPRNGELHPDGVVLVGGRDLTINVLAESGDDDDPPRKLAAHLAQQDYARVVARLEETSFRNALLDSDDPLEPDAQRDVLFERARIGLADDIDNRPAAEARYDYRGIRERYGMVRSREPLLPVELVVQGSLTDLQLGAFPRLRPPKTTPDALLYK
jgi:hypothetical protein